MTFPNPFGQSASWSPHYYDFTALGDGALPSPWVGATFAISSAKLINTPTLGDELLTDSGLEANYTDGLCDTLTKNGVPTVVDGAPDVHGGSHAQSFEKTGTNQWIRYPVITPVANAWYLASLWHKMTVGAKDNDFKAILYHAARFPSGGAGTDLIFTSASWTQKKTSLITGDTTDLAFEAANSFTADAHTVIVDDGSVKRITVSTLFAMLPAASRSAIVKVQPSTLADNTLSGVVMWADAQSNPTTYLIAIFRNRYNEIGPEIGLMKVVNSVPTQLVNMTYTAEVADAWIEIRPTDDDTVGLYYNNIQIGSDVDVSDVTGACPGLLISGGNSLKGFFVG